uniref:SWIM-type domain-containing protein n=1 Tax=Lactuca sativa TaxID=4236 RepID=A0A9R1UHP6_LACSA|nr:hypothetical protein LSAT_V11C900462780 [Lactuca sativa]
MKEIVHLYLEVFQGLVEQTEAVEKVVPYNVENIVSDNVEECREEETVAVNTVEEKNLYEFGRLTDKTLSDGEESNEGWSEDEYTHGKKASDIFYSMPPTPDCPDPIVEPGPFHSLDPNDDINYGWEQPDTAPWSWNIQKKSGLTWTWFLEKLYECVGDCQELTFVTDRADAIRVSIENVFPHAHHGLCAFHLLGNIVHRFGKNDKTKVLFRRLVKAYKRNVFEELWYIFSSTRPQVAAYLSEIPIAKWTRSYSLSKRYDYMTSNSVESMNALSVDARKMPIIPLLEFFRRLSEEWCNKRRIEGGKRSTMLTEWAEKVVSKNEEHTTRWSVSGVSDAIYQVHDFKPGGIVDLRQETCTCKYWEGTGLPCGHVIMVLKHLKKTNFGHLTIDAYKMETYRSTYEEPVYPLPEPCDWEIPAEMMAVKPPIMDTC